MKKYRYKFGNGLGDFKGEHKDVKMLEEFAKLGYRPIKVSNWGYYKFKLGSSESCSYSIDVAEIKKKSQEFADYQEIFVAAGWEYVLSYYDWHYFKAPKGTKPIYSDTKSLSVKYENMQKQFPWLMMVTTIIALVFAGLAMLITLRWLTVVFAVLAAWSAGVTFVVLCMAVSNYWRIRRFSVGDDEKEAKILTSLEVAARSAQDYEQLSKTYQQRCLISLIIVGISLGMLKVMAVLNFRDVGVMAFLINLLFGGLLGGFVVYGLQNLFGFITNKNKASKLADKAET